MQASCQVQGSTAHLEKDYFLHLTLNKQKYNPCLAPQLKRGPGACIQTQERPKNNGQKEQRIYRYKFRWIYR